MGQKYDLNSLSEISFDKDNLTFGTVFSEKITGTEGQDYIDGYGGADIINGGSDSDYLIMFESSNNIQISEINGVYRLSSKDINSYYYSPAKVYNVEHLLLTNDNVSLETSDLTNFYIYEKEADSINGTISDEIFDGGGGSDIIDGKLGNDTAIFTSINDASIDINSTTNTTFVSFKDVDRKNMHLPRQFYILLRK